MAPKPKLLKDYLGLEEAGRRPTMRRLLDAELTLGRVRKNPIAKLSAAIVRALGLQKASHSLSRGFSKRFGTGFWKAWDEEDNVVRKRVGEIVWFFDCEEACSCSSSSRWSSSTGSDCLVSSAGESQCSSGATLPKAADLGTAMGRRSTECEEILRQDCCKSEEEKEQLSPVSVMDFPRQDEDYDDGAEESTTECFLPTLDHIERTKMRRLGRATELEPVHLDHLFKDQLETRELVLLHADGDHANNDYKLQVRALELLKQLERTSFDNLTETAKKVLVDFFVEGLLFLDSIIPSNIHILTPSMHCTSECIVARERRLLLKVASDWVDVRCNGLQEDLGIVCLREMEKDNGWRSFQEDEKDVALEAEDGMLNMLMDELVRDLLT